MFVHEAEAVNEQCTTVHAEQFRGLLLVSSQAWCKNLGSSGKWSMQLGRGDEECLRNFHLIPLLNFHTGCRQSDRRKWFKLTGFKVFTKSSIVWELKPCSSLKGIQRFREKCCLHLQDGSISREQETSRKKVESRALRASSFHSVSSFKLMLRRLVVRMGGGWNWLRIVSSCELLY
jgi:hypothetical protein